jgi:hypothetical protein
VRVRTGEWRDEPDDPRAWATVDTVIHAVELIKGALPAAPTRETTSSPA